MVIIGRSPLFEAQVEDQVLQVSSRSIVYHIPVLAEIVGLIHPPHHLYSFYQSRAGYLENRRTHIFRDFLALWSILVRHGTGKALVRAEMTVEFPNRQTASNSATQRSIDDGLAHRRAARAFLPLRH